MRIVLWHGYLLGGTGSNVYTRALAREWSRAGHTVVVICQEPHPERYDLGGARVFRPNVGGLLPVFAGLGEEARHRAIAERIAAWRRRTRYGIASHDPADRRFEPKRYWRGPIWIIVNMLVADGLRRCKLVEAAAKVEADSLSLIEESGFAEYYDPISGEGLGGGHFTWTAAMVAELVKRVT